MTDKKFTDEEIIETLERCSKGDGCFGCAKAYMHSANCIRILETECLDLINRQKAEIEQWQEEANSWQTRFCKEIDNREEIKAEAYKEFTEKAKKEFLNLQYNAKTDRKNVKIEELKEQMDWLLHTVAIETVDNLLKEMVGEEE